jgi:prepilin-type N-terminal cleavage/methylation domain-containing protein
MKINLNSENYRKIAKKFKPPVSRRPDRERDSGEAGFSLIEVCVAMVIFLIAVLGVFISFAYAVNYNSGNTSRAQALALLQQKVEQMRSARFVPTMTDDDLTGGTKAPDIRTAPDGNQYRLDVVVDDDPSTEAIDVDPATKFKEVSVTVSLERPTPGWQTSVPAKVILQRVMGN